MFAIKVFESKHLARDITLFITLSKLFYCSICIKGPLLNVIVCGAGVEFFVTNPTQIVDTLCVAGLIMLDEVTSLRFENSNGFIS